MSAVQSSVRLVGPSLSPVLKTAPYRSRVQVAGFQAMRQDVGESSQHLAIGSREAYWSLD